MNYLLDEENSRSSFKAYAPMHTFKGWVDKGLMGSLGVDMNSFSISSITAVAKTEKFDTGDAKRNKAMEEFFELEKHTLTSFTMTEIKSFIETGRDTYQATIMGILDFAGVRRILPIVCNILRSAEKIVFDIDFKWSFRAYGIKAPQLLFLTVRDIVDINAHLEFVRVQEGI